MHLLHHPSSTHTEYVIYPMNFFFPSEIMGGTPLLLFRVGLFYIGPTPYILIQFFSLAHGIYDR
jgi:hypothetical protein